MTEKCSGWGPFGRPPLNVIFLSIIFLSNPFAQNFADCGRQISGQGGRGAFAAGEIFELAVAGGELVFAGDEGDLEAAAVGVFELVLETFWFGIKLDAQAGRSQSGSQLQIVVQPFGDEVNDED